MELWLELMGHFVFHTSVREERGAMAEASHAQVLFGHDATEAIVAVELASAKSMRIYQRVDEETVRETTVPFQPWLVVSDEAVAALEAHGHVEELSGALPLRWRISFKDWHSFRSAAQSIRDQQYPAFVLNNPVDQFLTTSGKTLFKGMEFDEPLRMQIDIETAGLNALQDDAFLLAVALSTNRGHQEVLHENSVNEPLLLRQLTERIRDIDPDVIEGHNIFNFDLPFLRERARKHRVSLPWGRDGSSPKDVGTRRLKVSARSIPFKFTTVYGRHIIDTYQQIQRYDSAGELQSYGLKESIEALGLGRSDRTFIPGTDILSTWRDNPERLRAYALDDVHDVSALSSLSTPTEFYQTQILPRSYQDVAIGGPGEKINLLLARAYLSQNHSLPKPQPPRPYPGGYAEVKKVGVFRPVVKCDVESLYPSIMLRDHITPASDHLNIYPALLQTLTERRLDAKHRVRHTSGSEQARWNGLQSSFKVLINSFYGNLGYSRALFNDFNAAEQVTLRGQEIIRSVVANLEDRHAETIEVDTDGVYFRPPEGTSDEPVEEEFVAIISDLLPAGINLIHDGSYLGMLSLRTKNYALLTRDNRIILKGSSLRSRRDERFFRRFIEQAAKQAIAESPSSLRELYLQSAHLIQSNTVSAEDFAHWETISEKTFRSDSNRKLAELAKNVPLGERVAVYRRVGGELALLSTYDNDADLDYLLRRLRDMAARFRPIFADEQEYRFIFPVITMNTDISQLQDTPHVRQMQMFS